MTITKADLVETLSRQVHPTITKRDVGKLVQLFIDEICKMLLEGNRIEIRGFGVMSTKLRKPKAKEPVQIPPRRVPVFKASRLLKASLMKGGQ
jgi:integration host factor subunit beta